MPRGSPGNRREQILQTFATMLESRPGSRITTAALAREVGRSAAGDFDFDRDVGALFSAPSENRFIVKVNYWLGL